MGQQQLLLLVLGIIIVGIAVAAGIQMFNSAAIDANRNAVTMDVLNLGSKAQQFYKKPPSMAGGGGNFRNFTVGALDLLNANGAYRLATAVPATKVTAVPAVGTTNTIGTSQTAQIYIIGYGTETGNDGTNLVMVYGTVTPISVVSTILN